MRKRVPVFYTRLLAFENAFFSCKIVHIEGEAKKSDFANIYATWLTESLSFVFNGITLMPECQKHRQVLDAH